MSLRGGYAAQGFIFFVLWPFLFVRSKAMDLTGGRHESYRLVGSWLVGLFACLFKFLHG
jgi:hypothetical protein